MDEIVRLVESKIPREMIVNGEPEETPGAKDTTDEQNEGDEPIEPSSTESAS